VTYMPDKLETMTFQEKQNLLDKQMSTIKQIKTSLRDNKKFSPSIA
jgi:chaperonin cofactor prefoldin